MTRLVNASGDFADEALEGFAAANSQYVQRVHGGVVRSTQSPAGQVALVLGGGAGHYPAFAGWVGPGMGHGAACGNVFASPAAAQVYAVARASENGAGVILGFGNYAGDVLHFGQAADRLRAEGVDVRVVVASDDIASAAPEHHDERRGIAGDLLIFKITGAAAEAGMSLDEVERVARKANAATRSLGVAFGGCTLPGADHPLFSVPAGVMATGLGIHGEAGIAESALGSASDVADALVDGILAEEPAQVPGGYEGRVAVLLNGLGATKYEELFVVYARVALRLRDAGLTVVAPEVGEHVTSLDMAGLSLTLTFLDSELEQLWTAPADTPAFRRGNATLRAARHVVIDEVDRTPVALGTPASQADAATIVRALQRAATAAADHERAWGDLDAVAGDGDHGQGMVAGSSAALLRALELNVAGAGARSVLTEAGAAWAEGAGGTSGALWGAALAAAGAALTDEAAATAAEVVAASEAATDAIVHLGGATLGDKTMVDAALPFVRTLRAAHDDGASLAAAWGCAASAARTAAEATSDITARLGRAKTHGDRSLGHPDPGAVSFALLVSVAGTTGTEVGA